MDDFIFYLISGLCWGSIIALIALGYTLVYGIIKLINFAHGEFYMVGAYAGFAVYHYVLRESELSLWIAIPAIVLCAALAGATIAVLTEKFAYKPIRKSGRLAALLTAIGVSFLLQTIFNQVDNGTPQLFGGAVEELAQHSVTIGSQGIRTIRFFFVVIAALLTVALWYFVKHTRFGRSMRAVSMDPDAAALVGIDIDKVVGRTFLLGGALAGIAGSLIALQSVVEPFMGFMPGLKAFVAAVVGGIGSIPGAVIGGFLIGIVESLVVWLGVPTGYKDIAAFVVLIAVLVVRPQGLLGRGEREKV